MDEAPTQIWQPGRFIVRQARHNIDIMDDSAKPYASVALDGCNDTASVACFVEKLTTSRP